MHPILACAAYSALMHSSRDGLGNAQRNVIAPSIPPPLLTVNQDARLIDEHPPYGALIEFPQLRQFLGGVVLLQSCAIEGHRILLDDRSFRLQPERTRFLGHPALEVVAESRHRLVAKRDLLFEPERAKIILHIN